MLTSIHDRLFRRWARLLLQGAPAVHLLASTIRQSTQRLRALEITGGVINQARRKKRVFNNDVASRAYTARTGSVLVNS
jgi:hypothetical protein